MKFNLEKKDIDSALLSLSAVADKKQTLPVLSNILIKAQENGLNMLSTDLEIELEMDVENVVVEEPGEITIPAKKASDIVKELPDGNISFSLEEGEKFKIKTTTGEYNLVTMEASSFPEFSSTKIDNAYEINSEELIELFQMTSFAMGNQDWRHYLNGTYIECAMGSLKMVATDAHRLAMYKKEFNAEAEFTGIIPRKTCMEIMRILPKENEKIKFFIDQNRIVFSSSNFIFKSKLIDANYPNYNQVIPSGDSVEIKVNREELLDIVSRVSVLSNDKFKGVKLKSEGNLLKIFSSNNDQESAEEELQLEVANEGFNIAFNVFYLQEMLNTIDDKSISILDFGGKMEKTRIRTTNDGGEIYEEKFKPSGVMIKTSNHDRTLVLMPVRL